MADFLCYTFYMQKNRGIIVGVLLSFVAILLSLFVLGFFTTARPYGLPNFKEVVKLPCGLTVYNLESGDTVSFPLRITGYANGCGWMPTVGTQVGIVTVVDSFGIIQARVPILTSDIESGKPFYFETIIEAGQFFSEEGLVIIDNIPVPNGRRESVQYKVQFKHKI